MSNSSFRQVIMVWLLSIPLAGAGSTSTAAIEPLRILQDQPPVSLNPRSTSDANGQRILSLLFAALTRLDSELAPTPYHALNWKLIPLQGARGPAWAWQFEVAPDLKDSLGDPITAADWKQCLENYRTGKPTSVLRSAFPHWLDTSVLADGKHLQINLSSPDPYLPRNFSALKFFRARGSSTAPCSEPTQGVELVTSGRYTTQWPKFYEEPLTLTPVPDQAPPGALPLRFEWIADDHTRLLKLLRHDVDVALTSVSLTKTEWLRKKGGDSWNFLDRESTRISYLAFNQVHPILKDVRVRRALALSIPRKDIIDHKWLGHCTVASSLLSPLLPESLEMPFEYSPSTAQKLLDEAGYPRGPSGIRLKLRYKTTPVKEGLETALIFQNEWKKIGVQLDLDMVEPAVFQQAVRKGEFEIYSSRWLGVADGSILHRTLKTGQPDNRVKYSNPQVDQWLEQSLKASSTEERTAILRQIQRKMLEDLPYFPLWHWNSTLIYGKDLMLTPTFKHSLSGNFDSLLEIRRRH